MRAIPLLLLPLVSAASPPCFGVSSVAGTGVRGNSPDGIPATAARLDGPSHAFSFNGSVLFVDLNYIRSVDAKGTLRTFAGYTHSAACAGAAGDGGPATSGCLANPAFGLPSPDIASEVVFSDSINSRVRVVLRGAISTAAGTGAVSAGGDGGPATAATLGFPAGLAFTPAGDLVVADVDNHCLRLVGRYSGLINTLAGACATSAWGGGAFADGPALGGARFNTPYAVAARPGSPDVWIADRMNHRIRVLSASSGAVSTAVGNGATTWNGDGAAATVQLFEPSGLAWAPDGGALYFSDGQHHVVRVLDAALGTVVTIAGTGGRSGYAGNGGNALAALFNLPSGLSFSSNRTLLLADTYNRAVRQLTMCAFR